MTQIEVGHNVCFVQSRFKSSIGDTAVVRNKFNNNGKVSFEVKADNGLIFCVDDKVVLHENDFNMANYVDADKLSNNDLIEITTKLEPLIFRNNKYNAEVHTWDNKTFYLQPGAFIRVSETSAFPKYYKKIRNEVLNSSYVEIIISNNDYFVIVEEIKFNSLSAVASVISGLSASGNQFFGSRRDRHYKLIPVSSTKDMDNVTETKVMVKPCLDKVCIEQVSESSMISISTNESIIESIKKILLKSKELDEIEVSCKKKLDDVIKQRELLNKEEMNLSSSCYELIKSKVIDLE